MVKIYGTVSVGGEIKKIILRSNSAYDLQCVDYQLNPRPHDKRIFQISDNEWEMAVSDDEMDKIISGFAFRD